MKPPTYTRPILDAPTDERDGTMVEPAVVHDAADDEQARLMAFVDALAVLAADLWFEGKLDSLAPDEEAKEERG